VRDNLPGTREFCPLIRKTAALLEMMQKDLHARAQVLVRTAGSQEPDFQPRKEAVSGGLNFVSRSRCTGASPPDLAPETLESPRARCPKTSKRLKRILHQGEDGVATGAICSDQGNRAVLTLRIDRAGSRGQAVQYREPGHSDGKFTGKII
jgi:hypothetical protein